MNVRSATTLFTLALVAVAAGCTVTHDGAESAPAPGALPGAEQESSAKPQPSASAQHGTIPFRQRDGTIKDVRVTVRNGRAYLGDMGFGPIEDQTPRGAGLGNGDLWPNGNVPYCFLPGLLPALAARFVEATHYIERRVEKVHFQSLGNCPLGVRPAGTLGVLQSSAEEGTHADVGPAGYIYLESGVSDATIRHELGHTLGFRHEQARVDRGDWVEVCDQNIQLDKRDNYEIATDAEPLTPYDYHSIMHYFRDSWLVSEPSSACGGFTMRPLHDTFPAPQRPGIQTAMGQGDNYTREDINALSLMYGQKHSTLSPGEQFGASMAVADFDRDGYDDVVVGAPRNEPGFPAAIGWLFYYKGTHRGLAPARILAPDTPENLAGDHLGTALTVGDFDNDGFPDLAAGAPDAASPGESTRAGVVRIFYGGQWAEANRDINSSCATTTPNTCGAPNDTNGPFQRTLRLNPSALPNGLTGTGRFGGALAAGDFNGDGLTDLVVGAPGTGGTTHGRVFLYHQAPSSSTGGPGGLRRGSALELIPDDPPLSSTRYGSSFAVGDFDGRGRAELAIGAPDTGASTGKVYLFWPTTTGLDHLFTLTSPGRGFMFGMSLVAANVRGDPAAQELVVGAPLEPGVTGVRSGAIHVYEFTRDPMFPVNVMMRHVQEYGSDSNTAERFGWAMAATSTSEIAVGAPTAAGGGRAVVLGSNVSGTLVSHDVLTPLISDAVSFGSSFGVGRFRNALPLGPPFTVRLLVGAPRSNVPGDFDIPQLASGAILGFEYESGHTRFTPMVLHSATASPFAPLD